MKTLKNLTLLFAVLLSTAVMISCEEEEPTKLKKDNCLEQLEALSDILYDKSMTFNNNPTSSNCSAMRTAALNLIDKAEDCGYAAEYEGQREFWVNYDCSEFD